MEIVGAIVLIGLILVIYHQLSWREPPTPGFYDPYDPIWHNRESEPETTTLEERIKEAKEKLVDS